MGRRSENAVPPKMYGEQEYEEGPELEPRPFGYRPIDRRMEYRQPPAPEAEDTRAQAVANYPNHES